MFNAVKIKDIKYNYFKYKIIEINESSVKI